MSSNERLAGNDQFRNALKVVVIGVVLYVSELDVEGQRKPAQTPFRKAKPRVFDPVTS